MNDYNHQQNQEGQERRKVFYFDVPLAIFLLLSCPLIFATATLALQRDSERWLPVSLVSESSANYSPDAQDAPKLAHVKPQIIQAVKEDEQRKETARTPTPAVALPSDVTPTATVSPTPSATPSPGNLVVNAGGPYETDEGSPASLTASGFNSVLSILPGGITYLWDLDGDGLYDDAEGASTQVIFYDEGDYPVAVKASDLFGRSALDLTTVAVNNVAPIVILGPDQSAEEGQEIAFLGEATDPGKDILLFEWDFGDGSPLITGTTAPTHIFRDDGEYVARLRVSDNDGGIGEAFMAVDVANLPPLVDAGPDQTVDEGDSITLSGTAADPADPPEDLSYAWDFDFDGENFTPDASGATVSTVYEDGPADIVAALRVEDKDGGNAIATVGIKVNNVDPVITSVSHNGPIDEGEFLNIEITASDVGKQDRLTYIADFGGSEVSGSSGAFSKQWYEDGTLEIDLRVEDGDGGVAFTTTTVFVNNLPPIAVAQLQTTGSIYEGDLVTFGGSASSDPGLDPLTYHWDFGDGQQTETSDNPNSTHTYVNNGQYDVTLTVTDDSGATAVVSIPVTILNANPATDFIPDRTVNEGEEVTYEGNATDKGINDILSYGWDFDYDGATFEQNVTGKSVTWTYPDGLREPETYVVALRVQDSEGGQAELRTFEVKVLNKAPVAIIEEGDRSEDQNEPITLVGRGEDVTADQPSLTYKWALDRDGVCNDAEGQTTVTKAWSDWGEYEVKLCVTDKDGGEGTATTAVDINGLPIVAISQSLTTTLEGMPVTFDGSRSKDPDGDIDSYRWDFGDGSGAIGITATHIYTDNALAPYIVTLRVEDNDDGVSTGIVTVTINNANPTANAGPDRIVNENTPLTLTGTGTDPGSADIPTLRYEWDFNYDGSNFDLDATQPATWPGADGPATITVALRVTDKDGGFRIDTALINVINVAPVANAGGPYSGTEGQPVTLTGSAIDLPDTLTYTWDLDNNGTFEAAGQTVVNTWSSGGVYTVGLQVTDDDEAVGQASTTVDINFTPIVDAGGPYSGNEAASLNFTGSASDPDGDSLTYTWNFGDGTPSQTGSSLTVSHTYTDNGNYTVSLQANDGNGGIRVATTTATISNLPPTARASLNPAPPIDEGNSITFDGSSSTDPSTGDPLSYEWDFGDGSPPANGATVTHNYGDDGAYPATLTVRDGDGGVDTLAIPVNVLNQNPTADAGGPYRTTLGVPITLSGSGSDVPADPLTYDWDLDNDGAFDDATGPAPTVTWPTAGPRTITLRVSDEDGGSNTDTATVDVGSPPVAAIGVNPNPASEGSPITFNGGGSSDPDDDPLTYSWDLDNDGAFDDGNGVTATFTYADNGSYTVRLRVADDRGGVDIDTVAVTVNNVPPTAVAAANPNPVSEGTTVNFNASGSSDPGSDTLSYSWDFGDGTTANGINVNHTYADEGNYTVTLLVDDGDGGTDIANLTVTVNNAPPVAVAGANPNPAPEGTAITFDAGGSTDPGSADTLSYNWAFGDGNSSTASNPTYTYADDGTYNVILTVTDNDGASDTETLTITVDNVAPTADAGGPYVTTAGNPIQLNGTGSDPVDSLDYNWDLDDNGSFETSGQSVTFTPPATGTYQVTLEVSDGDGGVTTDTTNVQVNSILPFAWLGLPFLLRRRKVFRERAKIGKKPGF